jgi:methanogenic corrinoid protein MtbC1
MAVTAKTTANRVAARRAELTADALGLLGGYPFRVARALWVRMGADGSAPDAASAVALGNGFVAARAA